jgi:hypothetical protein
VSKLRREADVVATFDIFMSYREKDTEQVMPLVARATPSWSVIRRIVITRSRPS